MRLSPVGMTLSMMYARIHGRNRSMIVPKNLMTKPSAMRA